MGGLGMRERMDRKALEAAKAAQAEASRRNDRLFENADFRSFLADLAMQGGYFGRGVWRGEWSAGYDAAMRGIVNSLVRNSTKGGAFLQELLADPSRRGRPTYHDPNGRGGPTYHDPNGRGGLDNRQTNETETEKKREDNR